MRAKTTTNKFSQASEMGEEGGRGGSRLRMGGSSSGTGGVGLEVVEVAGVVEAMP